MKKEDVTGVIVYLILIAAAIIFGLTVLQNYFPKSGFNSNGIYILFVGGAIVSGVLINAILLELGHIVGAKIGRYIITSTNILGFCFLRNSEGKYNFKFKSFDGLSGETKIVPKQGANKEPNPRPYLLFGSLFYLVELTIVIILFITMQSITNSFPDVNKPYIYLNVAYFFVTVAFIGALMLIYNIIPLHLDPPTDGYKLILTNNSKNRVAFNELLRVEYEISIGNSDVEIKTFDEITNFTADLNLNKVYMLLNQNKFDEALALLNQIISAKESVSMKVYSRALAQIIYIKIVTLDLEAAKKYYDEEIPVSLRNAINSDTSMVCLRTSILVEGLFDNSKSECLRVLQNVEKAYRHTPSKRKSIEVKLFNEAIGKVSLKHPKWEFEKYMLKETEEKGTKSK